MQGVISTWSKKSKNGRILIKEGETNKELNFKFNQIDSFQSMQPQDIKSGMPVSCKLNDRKDQITEVVLLTGSSKQTPSRAEVRSGQMVPIPAPEIFKQGQRFLNPYNFVCTIEKGRPKNSVLGDCLPTPHDRYVGRTGRITCKVKTHTPLFISDAHDIRYLDILGKDGKPLLNNSGEPKRHFSYRFFSIIGKTGQLEPAIPASSLRGMLRSVFELVTNSCFSIFDGDPIFETRERPEYGNRVKKNACIVRKIATEKERGEIELCGQASIGCYYTGSDKSKNAIHSRKDIKFWKSGEKVVARAFLGNAGRYIIREFAETRDKLQPLEDCQEYVQGWLKITGLGERTKKKNETLFLDPVRHGSLGKLEFDIAQQSEYNTILRGQIERGQLPVPQASEELKVGDLVWLETQDGKKGKLIRRILRVQIPRTPYKKPLKNFLVNDHLHCCTDYAKLCPACRVFGWVYQNDNQKKMGDVEDVAYAGRVRLSHAELITKEYQYYEDIPLAILSSPKPTKCQFYLLDQDNQPNSHVDYNSSEAAKVRGRKFYLHHKAPNSLEYVRAPFEGKNSPKKPLTDDQNRTVRGVLASGTEFVFTLRFENMDDLELGALLWVLELEEGMYHRLGYAKPLGFGSIEISVTDIEEVNWLRRLRSLEKKAGWHNVSEQKENLKEQFLEEMRKYYGESLDTLLEELRRILSGLERELPVHYPRCERKPTEKGENFKWFQQNKYEVLDLILEDRGLPYNC